MLLDRGADTEATQNDEWTAMMNAARHGYETIARMLLDRGADANAGQRDQWTPLMFAASRGHLNVSKLPDRGADSMATQREQKTPLMVAAQRGHVDMVELLLDQSAQIEQNLHTAVLKLRLDRNAYVNAVSNGRGTALSLAAENGHFDVVRLLMVRNADTNAVNPDGDTPLILAVKKGCPMMVGIVLEHGVNFTVRNKENKTAIDYAIDQNQTEIIQMMRPTAPGPARKWIHNRKYSLGLKSQALCKSNGTLEPSETEREFTIEA